MLGAPNASALDLHLTTSNDLGAGGQDDLYTGELAAEFSGEKYSITVGERIFTDRERELRFDETHLGLHWPVEFGRWVGRSEIEALRVGRGIAGESLQNAVHKLTGSEELDLAYPDENRHFGGIGLDIARPLGTLSGVDIWARLEAKSTPGFQHRIEPSIGFHKSFAPWFAVSGFLGAHLNETEFRELEPHIEEFGETWQAAVSVRQVRLAWSYNTYGTASRHLTLSYRIGTGGSGPRGRSE